jgi:hypothetical protein
MAIVLDDGQETVVEFLLGGEVLEGAVGDAIQQREVGGRVFFGGRFPTFVRIRLIFWLERATYKSSTRYGAESKEAWSATFTAGLAFTIQPGSKAPMAAYHRQEMQDPVEALIVMQWSVGDVYMLFWYRGQVV